MEFFSLDSPIWFNSIFLFRIGVILKIRMDDRVPSSSSKRENRVSQGSW